MRALDLRNLLDECLERAGAADLVTRRTGQAVRTTIERRLADGEDEPVTIIDFSSVRLIDLSCADEIVAKLLVEHRARHFLLRGVSEGHREAINPVLEKRGLAAVAQDPAGQLHALGRLPDPVRRAFTVLAARGRARVDDVATDLAMSPTAAQAVFSELLERRLARADGTEQILSLA